jgi:hypothetical protein
MEKNNTTFGKKQHLSRRGQRRLSSVEKSCALRDTSGVGRVMGELRLKT